MKKSLLQRERAAYQPKLPKGLQGAVKVKEGEPTQSVGDQEEIKKMFPNTYGMPLIEFVPGEETVGKQMNVGVILSGGQAPGGHNVICGIFDAVKKLNPENKVYGFLMGPGGLVDHDYKELTAEIIDEYRNTGGFDMIGSGRTKLEKEDQFDHLLFIRIQTDMVSFAIGKNSEMSPAFSVNLRLGNNDFPTFLQDTFQRLADLFAIEMNQRSPLRRQKIGCPRHRSHRSALLHEAGHLLLFILRDRQFDVQHCFIKSYRPVEICRRNLKKRNKLFHILYINKMNTVCRKSRLPSTPQK